MIFNHVNLRWQMDWRGPKLQNLRFLVCDTCYDAFQQNGQRTIILPADPIPIMNARPEQYIVDSNPLSVLGANPSPLLWQYSQQIGTMTFGAGVPAAFDGNPKKPIHLSAQILTPDSSYGNYVGINWSGYPATTLPASLNSPVLTHTLSSFTISAPFNATFGASSYVVQGANVNVGWASWTSLSSGDTALTAGEVISGSPVGGGRYQFHRVAFASAGAPIAVSQVSFSVSDGSSQ